MEGQTIAIRIVTDKWMPVQRCHRYKYEVTSEDSPYYGNLHIILSDILLKAGHTYSVEFNDDTRNPRIDQMLQEILEN